MNPKPKPTPTLFLAVTAIVLFSVIFGYEIFKAFSIPRAVAQFDSYEVVPKSWITATGTPVSSPTGGTDSVAYIFPSGPKDATTVDDRSLGPVDFFGPHSHFPETTLAFDWSAPGAPTIRISVTRNKRLGTISVDSTLIRKLPWPEFRHLQRHFRDWLCNRSDFWFWERCDSTLPGLDDNLLTFWRDKVLASSAFADFSRQYLNPATFAVYYPDPPPTGFPAGLRADTTMFATQIDPYQVLQITWGSQNLYPADTQIQTGYTRSTPNGSTRITAVSDAGMRLFPARDCGAQGTTENSNMGGQPLLPPFPPSWHSMIGRNFLPIYNLFDLHNPLLLTAPIIDGQTLSNPPTCPDGTRSSPNYLFLLSPGKYVKPDMGDQLKNVDAQFETESRSGLNESPNETVKLLGRQFVVLGCDSSDPTAILNEWDRLIELAFATPPLTPRGSICHILPNPPGTLSTIPYVHGVFAGKSFVELRNHFSVNGEAVEGVDETVGQVLAVAFGAHLDMAERSNAIPLIELWRLPHSSQSTLGTNTIRISFDTTSSAVLDQALIREGDELYVRSVSKALR